ncbi:hemolysin-III related-domain-containing protein [Blastocladiella britannica]|nr:hemolysin-III related-domain-containing protein [Blastocladiella britannica]
MPVATSGSRKGASASTHSTTTTTTTATIKTESPAWASGRNHQHHYHVRRESGSKKARRRTASIQQQQEEQHQPFLGKSYRSRAGSALSDSMEPLNSVVIGWDDDMKAPLLVEDDGIMDVPPLLLEDDVDLASHSPAAGAKWIDAPMGDPVAYARSIAASWRFPLYKLHQVPHYLQFNPYVLTGYRSGYSHGLAWRSVFSAHNETGSIWTHLVFVPVSIALAMGYLIPLPAGASSVDMAVFAMFWAGTALCYLFSSMFHTLYCTNHTTYIRFGCLDYTGISVLMSTAALLVSHVALYNHSSNLRLAAFASAAPLALAGIVGPMFPLWHTARFRTGRTAIYLAAAILATAMPMAAVAIGAVTEGVGADKLPAGSPDRAWAQYGWAAVIGWLGFGTMAYVTKWPECWWPGWFDLLASSHQIWHLCVVIGVASHGRYAAAMLAVKLATTATVGA